MVYKIATFPRWADENAHVLRFLACFVAMLIELAWENGMVWIVSATDKNKYEDVEPLQVRGGSEALRGCKQGKPCKALHSAEREPCTLQSQSVRGVERASLTLTLTRRGHAPPLGAGQC